MRQCNTFFPDDPYHQSLKKRMAAETQCFIRALRNFLRGPSDDDTLRKELYELVDEGLMTRDQADAVMAALGPGRDATIGEVRASLARQGLVFGFGTIQRFFARHAITRKKRPRTPPSRTAPTS